MRKLAVGVDIGGTNTVLGLVDCDGKCYETTSFKTREYSCFQDYAQRLCVEIDNLHSSVDLQYELAGIGIGAPNANYFTGNIEAPANLDWKFKGDESQTDFPLVQSVQDRFPALPIVMTNDANTAAIGEMYYGAAKGMKNFVVITLGTGLGSGFVSSGNLIYGHDSFAGELGHIVVERNGRQCGCGNRGCLETYVSATGIKRTVFELLAECNAPSVLRSLTFEQLESKDVYDAAIGGDEIALKAFEITGSYLGQGIATAVAITSPEAVFLFGGLAKSGNLIMEPTKRHMEQFMLKNHRGKVKLMFSGIDGANASVLGASALVWQAID